MTIKPGSVETPIIAKYPRHGAISPKEAAEYIIKGIKRNKKIIQFPFSQVALIRITDYFPVFVYDSQDIDQQKGEGYPIDEEQ